MKIFGDKNPDLPLSEKRELIRFKTFSELITGDKFKAIINDISRNGVVLLFDDGTSLTARSMVLPDARIGDEAIFLVKENIKGQVFLEMVRPDADNPRGSIVRESLEAALLPINQETIELVSALIDRELPIDAATISKAAYFKFSDKLDIEKVMFLVEEELPVEAKTINTIKLLLGDEKSLIADVERIILEINTADVKTKQEFAKQFELGGKPEPLEQLRQLFEVAETEAPDDPKLAKLVKSFARELMLDLKAERFEPEKRLAELTVFAKVAKSALSENKKESSAADKLVDKLEFIEKITQYKEYVHLPFFYDDFHTEAELHVFKKTKNEKIKDNASALLALDMLHLGHIDVFINKKGRSIGLEVKAGSDDTLRRIMQNSPKLGELLNEKGYHVSSFTSVKSSEKFNISSPMKSDKKKEPKRYTLDMRV